MVLVHFVLFLSVVATCAVEFEMWEKTPDNNPDLNTEGLGTLQDAWQTIRYAKEEDYYLMYNSHGSVRYKGKACVRVRTNNLRSFKAANYTHTWYNLEHKKMETRIGGVEARKQKDYVSENIMRFSGLGPTNCRPYLLQVRRRRDTKGGSLNGSYNMIEYYDENCKAGIRERPQNLGDYDEYLVFSEKRCYVSRSVRLQGSCEFWVRASWLNQTLSGIRRCRPKNEEGRYKDNLVEETENSMQPMEALFKELPISCRLAFLFNCGYPTSLIYNKIYCDIINKAENVA